MKKYAVICLTAVLLFILTGCNTVEEIKPAETADEAAKQYIAMMKSGDKDLITDPEEYEQIIKAFGKDAWDNAEYTIYEGNCPETREGWIMHSSGIEISEEEAASANSAFWEKVASDHNTTIEKITLSPDETYTEDEWIHLSSLYRDYVDRQPAWPPVSFPLYDYAKVSFTFAGQDEDSEGNGDYHIHISNKNGLWEVAEPLSFNSGAYEPIDEYSISYKDCLFTLWDEQDVIERQPINLRIISREDTILGYGADTYTGCHEIIIRYKGLIMKTIRSSSIDSRYHLFEMEVTAEGFKTYRNIQVGDTLEYLIKQYPELEHPDYMPHSYIMDNGGQGIQFIVSDNTVRKIILKHGFDGPPYFDDTAFAVDTDFEQHKDYPEVFRADMIWPVVRTIFGNEINRQMKDDGLFPRVITNENTATSEGYPYTWIKQYYEVSKINGICSLNIFQEITSAYGSDYPWKWVWSYYYDENTGNVLSKEQYIEKMGYSEDDILQLFNERHGEDFQKVKEPDQYKDLIYDYNDLLFYFDKNGELQFITTPLDAM